jgi:hypothetical protein
MQNGRTLLILVNCLLCLFIWLLPSCTDISSPQTSNQIPPMDKEIFDSFPSSDSSTLPPDSTLVKIYSAAISDYLINFPVSKLHYPDTLFIIKQKNNLPDDFPEIELPTTIYQTPIQLVTLQESISMQQESPQRIFVNLPAWISRDEMEFIFVTFSEGGKPQFSWQLNYQYDQKRLLYSKKITF